MPLSSANPFADLAPGTAPASLDEAFDLRPGERDPLADFMVGLPCRDASSPDAAALSKDPLVLSGGTRQAVHPADDLPTTTDDVPALPSAYTPPAVRLSPSAGAAVARVAAVAPPVALPPPVMSQGPQGDDGARRMRSRRSSRCCVRRCAASWPGRWR